MVAQRAQGDQPSQPGWVALTAAMARESRYGESVTTGQHYEGAVVHEAPNRRAREDVPARRPNIALRGKHAEWRIEVDPRHERTQIPRGLVFGRTAKLVLYIVASQDDQVWAILEPGP
jgi:hypothetical protein